IRGAVASETVPAPGRGDAVPDAGGGPIRGRNGRAGYWNPAPCFAGVGRIGGSRSPRLLTGQFPHSQSPLPLSIRPDSGCRIVDCLLPARGLRDFRFRLQPKVSVLASRPTVAVVPNLGPTWPYRAPTRRDGFRHTLPGSNPDVPAWPLVGRGSLVGADRFVGGCLAPTVNSAGPHGGRSLGTGVNSDPLVPRDLTRRYQASMTWT